ncbi:hypothetical protein FRC17_004350 [Serendipita sp. 399]|nr:hypothetical protein FRC17_004350 [Serendipita sp. 399]
MAQCFFELSLLGNLQTVELKELDLGFQADGGVTFIEVISALQPVKRLKMQGEPWQVTFPIFHHVKELEVISEDVKTWEEYPFSKKIAKSTLLSVEFTIPKYADQDFLKNYSGPKELYLGEFWLSLEDLCIALAAASNLTHLKFKYSTDPHPNNNPQHECRPTGLSKLSHLTITLREGHRFMDEDGLYWLVQSIGGQSHLHNLGIFWYNHRPATTRCERLLQHMFITHGLTLERLKLPFFRMTKATFHSLARRVPKLSQLWIGATVQMMNWLADALCTFPKLERLRLYNLDHRDFPFGFSFLQQTCPTLKVIKSNWVYDPSLGPTKRIMGPAHENPIRWKTSKGGWRRQQEGYATDSGSEMDFG